MLIFKKVYHYEMLVVYKLSDLQQWVCDADRIVGDVGRGHEP